jgi:hypothetical protein
MSNKDAGKADVLQGTLDLLVLQTLESMGAQHGYAIAARLEQVSAGALQLNMGTLYPALMRLEQRGPAQRLLGRDGHQPESALLFAHGGRPAAADDRAADLGSHGRHHPKRPPR